MSETERIILAIETAVQIPSVSILKNSRELDFWVGDKNTSGSESLLPAISALLQKNKIETGEISYIAVSVGPGSFTGVRIGLATVKGLGFSGELKSAGINALQALALAAERCGQIRSIISGGRLDVFVQDFYIDKNEKEFVAASLSEPKLQRLDQVLDELEATPNISVISSMNIDKILLENNLNLKVYNPPPNLARYVGLAAIEKIRNKAFIGDELKPLYVRQADFEKLAVN